MSIQSSKFTFNSCVEGLGASGPAASGSVDLFSDILALPSVIATIIMRPTSPLFSAFNPTLTAYKKIKLIKVRIRKTKLGMCVCNSRKLIATKTSAAQQHFLTIS
jgi:hypothetical protein